MAQRIEIESVGLSARQVNVFTLAFLALTLTPIVAVTVWLVVLRGGT